MNGNIQRRVLKLTLVVGLILNSVSSILVFAIEIDDISQKSIQEEIDSSEQINENIKEQSEKESESVQQTGENTELETSFEGMNSNRAINEGSLKDITFDESNQGEVAVSGIESEKLKGESNDSFLSEVQEQEIKNAEIPQENSNRVTSINVDSFSALKNAIDDAKVDEETTIFILSNITIIEPLIIREGVEIILKPTSSGDEKNKTLIPLSGNYSFKVYGTLSFDWQIDGGGNRRYVLFDGKNIENAGGIEILGGEFNQKKGDIMNMKLEAAVKVTKGTFNRDGGAFSGHEVGVRVLKDGTFNLNKVGVTTNSESRERAVYIEKGGTFNMKLEAVRVEGVYIEDGGIFNMHGGLISGYADTEGGGVYNLGTFNMWGGEISGNTVTENGGGVYNGGIFNMYGGSIWGNNATQGAGIYSTNNITIENGEISNNTASRGGGIYVDGDFEMNDGLIEDNTAINGGGIYHNSGDLSINHGKINHNEAVENGGAIFVSNHNLVKNNLIINENMWFEGNTAKTPVIFQVDIEYFSNLKFANTSAGDHILNNYDVYYYGELIFKELSENLYFEDAIISSYPTISKRKGDWNVVVSDTRFGNQSWRLTAMLSEEFKSSDGHLLINPLVYLDEEGHEIMMGLSQGIPVFEYTTTNLEDVSVNWEENQGILLKVDPSSYKGEYVGSITWTLVDAL